MTDTTPQPTPGTHEDICASCGVLVRVKAKGFGDMIERRPHYCDSVCVHIAIEGGAGRADRRRIRDYLGAEKVRYMAGPRSVEVHGYPARDPNNPEGRKIWYFAGFLDEIQRAIRREEP